MLPTFVRSSGASIYYRDSGGGASAVLLLHEYFGTGNSWAGQRSWLGRYHRVVTPDLRGHGRSLVDPDSRLRVSDLAEDMLELLDDLGVRTVHLIGCSLGAVVGLRLAVTKPGRVASLAIQGVPDVRDPGARRYAEHYATRVFPGIEASLDRTHGNGQNGYSRATLLRNFILDIEELPDDHIQAVANAREVQHPAIVIAADRDPVFTPRRALEMAEAMPDASLAVIPDTGHLVHQEMPGMLNQLILEHLIRSARSS